MSSNLRFGVVSSHPIQYFSPLYDLLTQRGIARFEVAYGNDAGLRPTWDPGFAQVHLWDIDLVGGHDHEFLTRGPKPSVRERAAGYLRLVRMIRSWDAVVINGYASALAVAAIGACQVFSIPYLIRSDTSRRDAHSPVSPRYWWPRIVSRRSAGGLAVGLMNAEVHRTLGSPSIFPAPFAVDTDRFHETAKRVRRDQLACRRAFGLPDDLPIVVFAGKLMDLKRPEDAIHLAGSMNGSVHVMVIGEGSCSNALRVAATDLPVTFTGFLNQNEIPEAMACADVLLLPSRHEAWGLVVNEGMACSCVPVVSDQVGCAPDLVDGLGEVYRVGDLVDLTAAVQRALVTAALPETPTRISERLEGFTLSRCAAGYEGALTSVSGPNRQARIAHE